MISIEKYKNVLDQGLLLDHYSLLCCIRDEGELPKSKRVQGFINLLHKKGYLKEDKLTELAIELIDTDTVLCESSLSVTTTTTQAPKKRGILKINNPDDDFMVWASKLHEKLQARLIEKTGKKQMRATVKGTTYSFFPNGRDLAHVLLRAIMAYNLKDFEKIEQCLLSYIDRKTRENNWTPLLGYYIMKDGKSAMVTDMENMGEENNNEDNPSIHIV